MDVYRIACLSAYCCGVFFLEQGEQVYTAHYASV